MSVALSKPRIGTGLTVEQALAQRRSVQTFAARSVAHKDVLGPTIYASDVAQSGTSFDVQLKALLADERVLGNRVHWTTIRNDHPIYQAFFEFPAGPPLSTSSASRRSDRVRELEKLELRSRVVAIFADLNISYG